jgi:hypothetical protein
VEDSCNRFPVSVFYALVHGMLPSDSSPALPPSVVVQQGLLPVAFILYGALWFGVLSYIFVLIQGRLPGRKVMKGVSFGVFFCLIAFMLYFEPLPTTSPFLINMTWMLGDGLPLILLGILLGLFLTKKTGIPMEGNENRPETNSTRSLFFVLVIPAIFLVGRLFEYLVFNVTSSFSSLPLQTISWVFLFGLGTSILYYWLRSAFSKKTPLLSALFFGLVMFGVNMFLFNFAYALIVNLTPTGSLDFFERISIDVLSITGGVYLCERINLRAIKNRTIQR